MPLQNISQGPGRVFELAKGAVPPKKRKDGHSNATGAKNLAVACFVLSSFS